jgi:hypothetical protein
MGQETAIHPLALQSQIFKITRIFFIQNIPDMKLNPVLIFIVFTALSCQSSSGKLEQSSPELMGTCSMKMEGITKEIRLFIKDTAIVLTEENEDPCFMQRSQSSNDKHYDICGFHLHIGQNNHVDLLKLKTSTVSDTILQTNPNTQASEIKVIEREVTDTIGQCRITLTHSSKH